MVFLARYTWPVLIGSKVGEQLFVFLFETGKPLQQLDQFSGRQVFKLLPDFLYGSGLHR